jgi:hypothetical protein
MVAMSRNKLALTRARLKEVREHVALLTMARSEGLVGVCMDNKHNTSFPER